MVENISRIIVIGSNSFIAKNVINKLRASFEILEVKKPRYNLLKYQSLLDLKKKITNKDIILFVAAEAPVKSWKSYYNNINMLNNFLKLIGNIKINNFVYISSDAVFSDSKKLINEKTNKEPENLHGLMHLNRENIITNKFTDKNFLILRPTLVYGVGDKHNGYGPNYFHTQIKNEQNINIFGRGEELRDHIHIDDLSTIISKLIKKNLYGDFNLVTGKVLKFDFIAKKMIKKFKSSIIINYLERKSPMPHNGYRAFDNKKLLKNIKNFKFTSFTKSLNKL